MKILHIFKVMFALIFFSHISYAASGVDPLVDEPQRKVASTTNSGFVAPSEITTFNRYVGIPLKAAKIFLWTSCAAPVTGVKSLFFAAYGYEGGVSLKSDERLSKFKQGLAFTLGAPFIGFGFAAVYAAFAYNGGVGSLI